MWTFGFVEFQILITLLLCMPRSTIFRIIKSLQKIKKYVYINPVIMWGSCDIALQANEHLFSRVFCCGRPFSLLKKLISVRRQVRHLRSKSIRSSKLLCVFNAFKEQKRTTLSFPTKQFKFKRQVDRFINLMSLNRR